MPYPPVLTSYSFCLYSTMFGFCHFCSLITYKPRRRHCSHQDEEEAEAAFNEKHALQKAKEVGPLSSFMSSE